MADQMKSQKLFYIADYFGNYYRLNENNELVASAGVNAAGVFTEQEIQDRIGQGKKHKYYRMEPVDMPHLEKSSTGAEVSEPQKICEKNNARIQSTGFNLACFTFFTKQSFRIWKERFENGG